MDYDSKRYPESGKRFAGDAAWHQMTVLHDDGLYRHLRFARSQVLGPVHVHTGMYYFDLITWPGFLTIVGDFGPSFVFSRERDMFGFFRGPDINPGYWAEKLTSGRAAAKTFAEEKTLRTLVGMYTEYGQHLPDLWADYRAARAVYDKTPAKQRYPFVVRGPREPVMPKTVAELRGEVADAKRCGDLAGEDGVRQLLEGWEVAGVASDTFELDFKDWHRPYLWACHAILWGIRQYGKLHSPVPLGPDRVTADRSAGTVELPEPVAAAAE
jgi:hypothetical protein